MKGILLNKIVIKPALITSLSFAEANIFSDMAMARELRFMLTPFCKSDLNLSFQFNTPEGYLFVYSRLHDIIREAILLEGGYHLPFYAIMNVYIGPCGKGELN